MFGLLIVSSYINLARKPQTVNAAVSILSQKYQMLPVSRRHRPLYFAHTIARADTLCFNVSESLNLEGWLQVFNAGSMQCCATRWFKNAGWKPIIQERTRVEAYHLLCQSNALRRSFHFCFSVSWFSVICERFSHGDWGGG